MSGCVFPLQEQAMFARTLFLAAFFVATMPGAHAAGEAAACLPDHAALAADAREGAGDLFTRPESSVPAAKRTTRGLYVTATDAYEMVSASPAKVLFIDVRTRGELQFIGMPTLVDAHVPFLLETSPPQWDEASATLKLAANPAFVNDVDKRLAQKGITRDDPVIVICQGGGRAARAANALTQAGYTKVYTTIDGFEGDPVADGPHKGERLVNGWRNAGLPWTAKLDRAKMYGLE
jgi:rhodanese-related sulfurtransferase